VGLEQKNREAEQRREHSETEHGTEKRLEQMKPASRPDAGFFYALACIMPEIPRLLM
jgi:hypothetical protein